MAVGEYFGCSEHGGFLFCIHENVSTLPLIVPSLRIRCCYVDSVLVMMRASECVGQFVANIRVCKPVNLHVEGSYMSSIYRIVLIFGLTSLISCATPPASSGRYFQFKHPVSGLTVMQYTLPTAEGCGVMLSSISASNKDFASFARCTDSSASQEMRSRATLYDKTFRYSFDLETITLSVCEQAVKDFLKSASPDSVSINAPCSVK